MSDFKQLFTAYYPRVKGFAARLLGNGTVAEDLAQDVFVWLWNNRDKLPQIVDLESYLFTASKNAVYQYMRRELTVKKYYERNQAGYVQGLPAMDSESDLYSRELDVIIRYLASQMPAKRRRVFEMSRFESMDNDQIAENLQISKRTVENHLTTALSELRKHIKNFYLVF